MERSRITIIAGSIGLGCLTVFLIAQAMRPQPAATSVPTTASASLAEPASEPPANDDDVYGYATLSKQKMAEALKDPDSAKYKNVHSHKITSNGKTVYVVCGEVNARNGFGGLNGYQRFMASPILVVIEGQTGVDFEDVWTKMCPASNQMWQATGW